MSIIDIKIEIPNLEKRFSMYRQRIQWFLAATMQTQRAMIFNNEGAYNGRGRWAPLKFRQGQILSDTGTLRKSIGPNASKVPKKNPGGIVRIGNEKVTIGTDLPYAAMMNYGTSGLPGGVLRPRRAQALKIPVGSGFIFRKSVTIPARDYASITPEDKQELEATLAGFVAHILNGGE